MKIWFKIARTIGFYLLRSAYNYIDADSDGKISEDEIKDFVKQLKEIAKNLKNISY